jgi:hypothetical protein
VKLEAFHIYFYQVQGLQLFYLRKFVGYLNRNLFLIAAAAVFVQAEGALVPNAFVYRKLRLALLVG